MDITGDKKAPGQSRQHKGQAAREFEPPNPVKVILEGVTDFKDDIETVFPDDHDEYQTALLLCCINRNAEKIEEMGYDSDLAIQVFHELLPWPEGISHQRLESIILKSIDASVRKYAEGLKKISDHEQVTKRALQFTSCVQGILCNMGVDPEQAEVFYGHFNVRDTRGLYEAMLFHCIQAPDKVTKQGDFWISAGANDYLM